MECLWRLHSHWEPAGDCHQQDPAVFYVCFHPDDGLSYYYLHDPGFLEKYTEVYLGSEEESLVLSIVNGQ